MEFVVVNKDRDAIAIELKVWVPMIYGKYQQDITR